MSWILAILHLTHKNYNLIFIRETENSRPQTKIDTRREETGSWFLETKNLPVFCFTRINLWVQLKISFIVCFQNWLHDVSASKFEDKFVFINTKRMLGRFLIQWTNNINFPLRRNEFFAFRKTAFTEIFTTNNKNFLAKETNTKIHAFCLEFDIHSSDLIIGDIHSPNFITFSFAIANQIETILLREVHWWNCSNKWLLLQRNFRELFCHWHRRCRCRYKIQIYLRELGVFHFEQRCAPAPRVDNMVHCQVAGLRVFKLEYLLQVLLEAHH